MIYIGEFFFLTDQQEVEERDRRHGEFNLILESNEPREAIDQFKQRIVEFRRKSEFFTGDCKIYFIRLLEFENFPRNRALMLNYKSVAGDPLMPFIGCTIPSDQTDSCRVYNWKDNAPEVDGRNETLFLEFKGSMREIES
ncbi:MAG TPA: hypothetical protein ACFCUC_15970 [Desulfobacterales bacterium]